MSERKYSQKGYQDGGERARSGARGGKAGRGEGPRGRGLGAPAASVSRCARCGREVTSPPEPGAACRGCGDALHSCVNCRHFDPSAPLECRQPIAERVASKSGGNQCDLFEIKTLREFASDTRGGAKDARAAFDDLFDF